MFCSCQYRQEHPNVTIELYNSHLEKLQDWLDRGKIDLAITSLKQSEDPKTFQELFRQRLLLAVPLNHPFTQCSRINLADLDHIVGLKWRPQQESRVVDRFCIFATSHNWHV
ncbi:LysR substrate-binding domain-containing protein [Myxosarcina sp. GI1(2024)]